MSSATPATASLADVPMSASSRHQFQQYLARLPSTSASPSSSTTSDIDTLLRRSAHLASQVDALHARVSTNDRTDDPQLFWSTLTLLTNLRQVGASLERDRSTGKARGEALTRTRQDVGVVESLLRLLSVSEGGSGGAFTAPVGSQAERPAGGQGGEKGYEYWKQRTLAAIDADDNDTRSLSSADDDAVSDTESVLTDPEIHLPTTKLGGLKPHPPPTAPTLTAADDDDLSEYDRAPPSSSSKPPQPTSSSTPAPPNTTSSSDTLLQSDRATHEALSSELLRMASVLKSNSLAFADSLERDRLLLEKAGTDLGSNLDLMTRTRGRLGVYSKKARSMGWFTLSAILVVVISWMFMFLLIRLT